MSTALVTDLYELKMAASYLRRDMDQSATFSLFVRRLPPSRGFLVAAGLADCLHYLETLAFDDDDLAWMDRILPEADVARFADLRFTGDVLAVPEGRVVLANEPLLEVTAPLPQAQLVESVLLNQITHQTALASKAVRCRLAAPDIELVDFALRRTHGVDAAMAVSRVAAIAGFAASSNVEAARRFGLDVAGTMAHSYVEAFPTEAEAFTAFATDFPAGATFLVDTYDTLEGVETAISVIHQLRLEGPLGIRIDSGDLDQLAREARKLLDSAGLPWVRIFASGGLDEYDLERFHFDDTPIDAVGVGTHMGVAADVPFLDSVYKLVEYAGRPVVKRSAGKATLAGPKQVWRRRSVDGDILATRDEAAPPDAEPLLVEVMRDGVRLESSSTVADARARLARDLDALSPAALELHEPVPPRVAVSARLRSVTEQAAATAGGGPMSESASP